MPDTTTPQSTTIDWSGLGPSWSSSENTGFSQSVSNSSSGGHSSSSSGLTNEGYEALNPLLGLGEGSMPTFLDAWTEDLFKSYRLTGDEITNALNQVANARAQQGILNGTEAQNLRANVLGGLAQNVQEQRGNALSQAINLKTDVIPTLIGLTQSSSGSGTSGGESQSVSYSENMGNSFSTTPTDYQIVSDLIQLGYSG